MKKIFQYTLVTLLAVAGSGCADYLDVVPDKTQEISLLFDRRESAYRALATCYTYMPQYDLTYGLLGSSDEMIMTYDRVTHGKEVMMGKLTADYPVMSYWSGSSDGWGALVNTTAYNAGIYNTSPLWDAIRVCNTLLDNINHVPDMSQTEISRWIAEVKALKAYYHFLLFAQYGPIPLIKSSVPIDVTDAELYVTRRPVDEVVEYIVQLLDEAINGGLPTRVVSAAELGRIDGVIAASLKAKVLLYGASPLFNNNPMYSSLANSDGTKLFPVGDEAIENEKWVKAADALKAAIDLAEGNGVSLYTYDASVKPAYDASNFDNHPDRVPYMYNYQYMMVDRWNKEVIWGESRLNTDWHEIQRSINYKDRNESSTGDAWQWFNPTMNSTEFFYTKDGLPMDEDPNFDYANRYSVVTIPTGYEDVAQEGEQTAKMHLGREPRFYASIGFDRSRVRGYGRLYDLNIRFGEGNGRASTSDVDNSCTGYFLRKLIHPETRGDGTIVRYPWPIIRLGELYLSYAEALNEAYGTSRQAEILEYVNKIRTRSGVPTVEVAWSKAKNHPNYYQTQEGMRSIIHQERAIELAFEGYRNDDVRRWIQGNEFNERIFGWDVNASSASGFYTPVEMVQLLHVFSTRNYLWPIPSDELVNNMNLVQNPGY
jgi:hypothetical protein